jgi:tetratricopeptide (TPR) repeat protein
LSKKHKTTGLPKRNLKTNSPSETLIQQGKVAFRRKDYDQAIIRWQMVRSQRTLAPEKQADLLAALAEAYFRRGTHKLLTNPLAANEDFQEASRLQPADALYAYSVGLSWHRANSLDEAIRAYRKVLEIDSNFARAIYGLGLALAASGHDVTRDPVWDRLDAEQQAILQQKSTATPLSKAFGYMATDQWESAKPLIQTALADRTSPLAHYYQGVLDARAGDQDAALDHWRRAYEAGLNTSHLINNLTLAYTVRAETALAAKQIDDALNYAEMGLIADATHDHLADLRASIHFERGYQAAEQGNWKKALDEWNAVEHTSGANARALAANIALAYEKVGEEVKAAEAWREFARRRPRKENADGWLTPKQVARLWTRISELYLKAGNTEEAITTLQNALKYQPDDTELGLSLVRGYISAERTEAAHNQLNRMLKSQPNHIETLVLKAELTQVAPQNRWYSPYYSELPGIAEWKAILATGDETYGPVAQQRLMELYEEAFEEAWEWGGPALAKQKAQAAFEVVPEDHFLRARYVSILLLEKPRGKKAKEQHEADIQAQVDLINLADEEALHQLIDAWHVAERSADAAMTLEKANTIHPLGPNFYIGIGGCALHRKQVGIAQTYFDEAMTRAESGERLRWQAQIGLQYADKGDEVQAEVIWKRILEEDAGHGYAHYFLWILTYRQNKRDIAKKHLKKAQQWANEQHDNNLKADIENMQKMFDNPFHSLFSMLPPGLDPSQLPPELLDQALGGILGDDFDDDLDDDFDEGFDLPFFRPKR